MFKVLCGMTGTVKNIEKVLWHIYELNIAKIPTRLKKKIKINKDSISKNESEKIEQIIKEIINIQITNRPILIGTRNIIDSKLIYEKLIYEGFKNIEILNAINVEDEVEIISKAGKLGKITIATNMAGRGTDIILSNESIESGGLHIIATERNESRRVDLQLYGRTSRQGQPGSASTFLSLDDNLIKLYIPEPIINLLKDSIKIPFSKSITINLYKLCQLVAEKNASKTRRKMLAIDYNFNKKMSFAKSK
jgi:preprotein translocase subunit SecA